MDVKIYPSKLDGEIHAVSSKTMAHRAFIAAALADGETRLILRGKTSDVNTTVNCLNSLGFTVTEKEDLYTVAYDSEKEKSALNVEDSAATFKMLLPVICALGQKVTITGKEKVLKNVHEITSLLKGCAFDCEKFPMHVSGKLLAGEYNLGKTSGSQFASGLFMALPLLDGDSKIIIEPEKQTEQFLLMTVKLLKEFGITIEKKDYGYFIAGGQKFVSPELFRVEGDYTNSAYFISANTFGNNVNVTGLNPDAYQVDKNILDFVKVLGKKEAVLNLEENPELAPILAVAACYSKTDTVIKNLQRVKLKETDRTSALIININKLGGEAVATDDGLIIKGKGYLKGGVFVDSFGDRRLAMAMAFAATFAQEPVTILTAQAVNKAYPNFFNDFMKLGGKCTTF